MGNWHKAEISDVALEFGTDVKGGRMNIDSSRARKGNNNIFRIPSTDAKSIVRHMTSDASLILLAVTYLFSSFWGHAYESVIGIVFVVSVFAFGCLMKYRSEMRLTNSYRMLLPDAKVTENGQSFRLSVFDVEVGDLISFSQGDIIPADARLVSSVNLIVAERSLDESSGKSLYKRLEKNHDTVVPEGDHSAHYENMVYAGSMVISGKGSAIVTEIGNDTVIAKVYDGISFAPQNDKPEFLRTFSASSKRFSLIALLSVIPISLIGLFTQTINPESNIHFDLLYMFLIAISLASTCMSELVVAPAEALVTKNILPSSRLKTNQKIQESVVTKLSAAESLADIDTVLILSPEILTDKKQHVRRVWFSDKTYRFDALKSQELQDLSVQVFPFFACMPANSFSSDNKVIKNFLLNLLHHEKNYANISGARFLRNYPIKGARSCVLAFDGENVPVSYISCARDIDLLRKCASFRTEGGGTWKLDQNVIEHIVDYFNACLHDGLNTYLFVSHESVSEKPIFEGIISIGEEFPYADGYLAEEFFESGIMPILIMEEESPANVNFALKCGLVKEPTEIAIASEFKRAGLQITDASIGAKAYIGFGKKGTESLVQRLKANEKSVLPIIKDSADRRAVMPTSVYATHQHESYDSVKIASSLSLKPADAQTRTGGLSDVLKAIKGSSIARLKLGVYKNFLVFSSFARITLVCLPMIFGKTEYLMTALMILLSGFISDYLGLLVIMYTQRTAVRPQNSVSDARRLFSPSLAVFSAVGAFFASMTAVVICHILVSSGKLSLHAAPTFLMYSCFSVQLLALGGFLAVLKRHTRSGGLDLLYFSILAISVVCLFIQTLLPSSLFSFLEKIGIAQISFTVLPYIVIPALISFFGVALIIGKMSSFTTSK